MDKRKRTGKKLWVLLVVIILAVPVLMNACGTKLSLNVSSNINTPTPAENSEDNQSGGNNPDNGGQQQNGSTTVTPEPTPIPTPEPTPEPTPMAQKKDIKVKALYLTGWTVGSNTKLEHFVNLAKTTEINSYVIDIKDDDGYVGYESKVPAVNEINAWKKKYDVDKVIQKFHENDIHIIGRLVCFKDPVLSFKKPELAVKNVNGGLWKDNHKLTWLDPYNKDSWPYIVEIAREAVEKGFDEIQFDYIRFPNDGDKKAMKFESDLQKHEAINAFLAYVKQQLPNVVISADVFGIICESPEDKEGLGQYLEKVGQEIDYISPMVYPSHYAYGQIVNKVKFEKPDLDPYGVVFNSLVKAKNRLSTVENYKADVRPYLQDFTASWLKKGYYQSYGAEQVRQQIKAVYDAGYEEWIFWNASNKYSEDAFIKENSN